VRTALDAGESLSSSSWQILGGRRKDGQEGLMISGGGEISRNIIESVQIEGL